MRPFAWLWRQVCRPGAWIRGELRAMTVRGTVRWYWDHFLRGVCFHMPLVILLIALLVLPFNVFGEGLGVLAKLHKGARLSFLRRKVNGEVWLPAVVNYEGSARVGMLFTLRRSGTSEFSAYRKYTVDTSSSFNTPK